jgi:hypothetical protein
MRRRRRFSSRTGAFLLGFSCQHVHLRLDSPVDCLLSYERALSYEVGSFMAAGETYNSSAVLKAGVESERR